MSLITSTEMWSVDLGPGGYPVWTYSVIGTWDYDTWSAINAGAYNQQQIKFTVLPLSTELAVMSLLGDTIVTTDITPTGYDRAITDVVKLGPPLIVDAWPSQPSGSTYSGSELRRYQVRYQQLRMNHVDT